MNIHLLLFYARRHVGGSFNVEKLEMDSTYNTFASLLGKHTNDYEHKHSLRSTPTFPNKLISRISYSVFVFLVYDFALANHTFYKH